MKLTLRRLVVALATGFVCHAALAADPLATVNGAAIPAERATVILNEQLAQGAQNNAELQNAIREELIRREILGQAAISSGIDKRSDVATQLDLARQRILIGAYLESYLEKNPVTEAEIKTEYNTVKQRLGGTEYKPRHILVETEAEAKTVIDRLKAGEEFAVIARTSKDPGSRERGGELGWSTPDQYVQPFAEALAALKKGEFSKTPVKSDFGYHVIKLDDLRDVDPPSLDEVKPQLTQYLEQQRVQKHMLDLRDKAVVK